MPDTSATKTEIPVSLKEALESLRPTLRRPLNLSAHDVSAVIVEPILTSLGWDIRDPRQVRRPDEGATLVLTSAGKTAITFHVFSSLSSVPEALSDQPSENGEWVIATNGIEWKIFNHRYLSQPFRTVSIKNMTTQKDAAPVLATLSRESFQRDGLTEAWMSEAIDRDIERMLTRHLDGSSQLVDSIKSGLEDSGVSISEADIRSALSRIVITLGDTTLTPSSEPEVEVPVKAPQASAKAKTTKAKSKSKAKAKPAKTAAKTVAKAPAKTAAKAAATNASKASKAKKPATAKAPKSATLEDKFMAKVQAVVTLPKNPDELEWPQDATHVFHRKKNIVFMSYDPKTEISTLLPGSILTASIGKSLSQTLIKLREDSIVSKKLQPYGSGMLKISEPITLPSPAAAASFSAAAAVKDVSAWKSKDGASLVKEKQAPEAETKTETEAETA